MGWRSWNFFQCNINQGIMQAQMDALTLPRHGTSLLGCESIPPYGFGMIPWNAESELVKITKSALCAGMPLFGR